MYRERYKCFKNEKIYIAGPECFYTHGYDMLAAMRAEAESLGFGVSLPNDHPLDLDNDNLQYRANSIMDDLAQVMNETTILVCDLEAYRGVEPDAGTIYEIGMAYAKGARCYGYTRDKRSLRSKNQAAKLISGEIYDERGKIMPYAKLPFSYNVVGATKIVEGDFHDCIKLLMTDLEEEKKFIAQRKEIINHSKNKTKISSKPIVFLSGQERYENNAEEIFQSMKDICEQYGLEAVTPLDLAPGVCKFESENTFTEAANIFDNNQQHVRNCDAIIANLNDFRGYEVCNDVAFECGMAYQLGKKMYGYMDDTRPAIQKIPHLGADREFRDQTGSNVENFDYPANLMFSCTMDIFKGKFEEIIKQVLVDLLEKE